MTESVFLNVPFDRRYRRLFDALVFAIVDCGFNARCALEGDDGSEVRLEKIYKLVQDCALGIHDLSRTTLDSKHRLPRFNMPLELGLFLGAKRFGDDRHRAKSAIILDRAPYRYQVFCSDIAGQDIRAHSNEVAAALRVTRDWLQASRPSNRGIPERRLLARRYLQFREDLPRTCRAAGAAVNDLTFIDYRRFVQVWRGENSAASTKSS